MTVTCIDKLIQGKKSRVIFMVDPKEVPTQQGAQMMADKSFTLLTDDSEHADSYKVDQVYEIAITRKAKG